jgi:NADH-quinone oxidoreductase subunit J
VGVGVSLETLLTNVIAFVAIFSALMVVFHRNPMVSVVFLIVNLISVALFFLFLDAQFLFAIQIIVYAGAIMVLFIFVVMLLNLRQSEESRPTWKVQRMLAYVAGPLLVGALWSALWKRGSSSEAFSGSFSNGFGSAEDMGRLLFGDYLFQFEAASVLLVVAMIGAVLLARRKES